jgi:hypothetical protein
MRLDNLRREMDRFGRETVEIIKRDIRYKNAIQTGRLLGSISYKLYERNDTIEIDFFMIDYGKYVDEGTRYIKARNFFKENINQQYEKWKDDFAQALSKDAEEEIKNILK